MIMTRKFGLILCFFCFGFTLFAQNQDCPIALDLVPELASTVSSIDLSIGYSLKIDPLTGPGEEDSVFADGRGPGIASNNGLRMCVGPPDEIDNVSIPNTAIPYDFPEEKSFWFSFKAATSGTFEMLITPDNLGGDFDFMIWEGDCPSNPCSIPLFCGSQAPDFDIAPDGNSIIEIQSSTGLSSDLGLDTTSSQIWAPITLKENTNYFVLLDHRRSLLDPTGPYPDIGCEVMFGGTAIIEPTKDAPKLEPIFPLDTTATVPVCRGTSTSFEVDLLNFDEPVDYIWTTPSGDIFTTSLGERDFLIQQSGLICVEIMCPIQKEICWEVIIDESPRIESITPDLTSCMPLTLTDYVEEVNGVPGFYDLLNEQFQEIDESNINIRGDYFIRIVNGTCVDTEPVTTTPPNPKLVSNGFGTCAPLPFILDDIASQIIEVNGYRDVGNLDIFFYEDSLQAVNGDTPITIASSFKVYWARGINDNDCFDVVPINIFDAAPVITSPIIPPTCDQFDLSSVILRTAGDIPIPQNQIQYFENLADANANDLGKALVNSVINNSGTYYARVTTTATCSTNIPLDVVVNQNPAIDPINDIDFCQEFNLDEVNLVETNGTIIERNYFNSEADANAAMDLSINSTINTANTYWIKGTDPTNNCSSVVSVTLTSKEPTINPVPAINECGDAFDLTSIQNLTEASGTLLSYSFYETEAEAMAGITQELTNVTTSDTYYIRGEDLAITTSTCFDVQTIELTLTTPNVRVNGPFKIRNGVFDLSDAGILDLDNGRALAAAGYYLDSLQTQQLPSPIVTIEGTYWIDIVVDGCSISRSIVVRPPSSAAFDQETFNFEFPCVKEDGIDLPLLLSGTTNGVDTDEFDIAFFKNEEDAEKGINELPATDLVIFKEGSIWVRKTDKTDNNVFGLIELVLTERAMTQGGIFSMDKETCEEDVLSFQFDGSAPFDIRYTDGTDSFDITIPSSDLFEVIVSPTIVTTYKIVTIKDSQGCPGLLVDNEPTFTPVSLNFTNPVTECDDQETSYIVSFKILSGDFQTLNVDLAGSIVDSQFISDPIPLTEGYSINVTDKNHSNADNCGSTPFTVTTPPVCTCDTEAAEMDNREIAACVGETVTAIVDQQAVLADNNDRTVYVLHTSDTDELGTIVDTNNDAPTFTLTPDLAGNRYYISAVSTRATDLLQNPALTLAENRCLKVAIGTPVDVRAIPTVSIILEKQISCFGEPIELTFEMPEAGPYNLSFFDGNTTTDLTNIRNGDTRSVSAEVATTFAVNSISYSNLSTCLNDMPDATATLEVFEPITIQNRMVNCEDNGENFTVSFEILGGDTTSYTVDGTGANIDGNLFTSELIENQTNYSFEVSDENGCMAAEVSDFGKCDCTSDIATNIEVLQAVSCANENDGIVKVSGINGALPYSFEWSNGARAEQLNGIGAGRISVSMTDGNQCEVVDSIELTSPEPITAIVNISDPSCSDLENGSIVINNVQGGSRPYSYSINGQAPKSVGLFANLPGQEYTVVVEDDRGCLYEETANVMSPDPLTIWFAQSEFNLVFGDSLALLVQANEDGLSYSWQDHPSLSCTNCSSPIIRPIETTTYSVMVINQMDCAISRDITVNVDNSKDLYSPTAFSPNGDGINDTFGLFGGNQVREIVRLQVFNRWGALLYSRINLPTTDNFEDGWNGNEKNGEKAPTGIYIYVAEIIYTDGTSEVVTGDVALMR